MRRTQHYFGGGPEKDISLNLIMRIYQPKLKNIPQSNWPSIFRTVKDLKRKKDWGSVSGEEKWSDGIAKCHVGSEAGPLAMKPDLGQLEELRWMVDAEKCSCSVSALLSWFWQSHCGYIEEHPCLWEMHTEVFAGDGVAYQQLNLKGRPLHDTANFSVNFYWLQIFLKNKV